MALHDHNKVAVPVRSVEKASLIELRRMRTRWAFFLGLNAPDISLRISRFGASAKMAHLSQLGPLRESLRIRTKSANSNSSLQIQNN